MSRTNFFIVKDKNEKPFYLTEEISNQLVKFALQNNFGIFINPRDYCDEILDLLNTHSCFCLSDSFTNIECTHILELPICSKTEFGSEFLKKFNILNDIVKLLFSNSYVFEVDFYISHGNCFILEDYRVVTVINHNLAQSFLHEVMFQVENYNYYCLPTAKFEIR